MKDYLLISTGKAGTFNYQHDDEKEAIAQGAVELAKGQTCELFRKHSDLKIAGVTVEKTELQKKTEQA